MKRLATILFLFPLAVLLENGEADSQEHRLGVWLCEDFEHAERAFEKWPDDSHARIGYALCLIASGQNTTRGIQILDDLDSSQGNIMAAFMRAEHISRSTAKSDFPKLRGINEEIDAIARVLFLINTNHDYPGNSYRVYEEIGQMELHSYGKLIAAYITRYGSRVVITDFLIQMRVLGEQLFVGEKSNDGLKLNDEFKLELESVAPSPGDLIRAIEVCSEVLALPQKRHFDPAKHEALRATCKVYQEKVRALQLWEEKRQAIQLSVIEGHCWNEIAKDICSEYNNLMDEFMLILEEGFLPAEATFDRLSISLAVIERQRMLEHQ